MLKSIDGWAGYPACFYCIFSREKNYTKVHEVKSCLCEREKFVWRIYNLHWMIYMLIHRTLHSGVCIYSVSISHILPLRSTQEHSCGRKMGLDTIRRHIRKACTGSGKERESWSGRLAHTRVWTSDMRKAQKNKSPKESLRLRNNSYGLFFFVETSKY